MPSLIYIELRDNPGYHYADVLSAINYNFQLVSGGTGGGNTGTTNVQPGTNITTGGTALTPIVSVVPSPSFSNLSFSGTGQFATTTSTTFSGGTVSGGTIYSGTTNLSSTIINIANFAATSTGDFTRVRPGSNISTGGTGNSPIISVVASPSFNGLTLSGSAQLTSVTATTFDVNYISRISPNQIVFRETNTLAVHGDITYSTSANLGMFRWYGDARFSSLSATTLSGGTIYSGITNLNQIFSQTAHTHTASQVSVTALGSPTYTQLQQIHDLSRSAGHLNGGNITDAGGGTINISAGQGFIRAVSNDTSTLFTFDWPSRSGVAIPNDTIRYVTVQYSGGTPQIVLYTEDDYDYRIEFPIGFVVNEGGTLYINDVPHSIGRADSRGLQRNYETNGRSRADQLGGLILGNPTGLKLSVSSGVTWLRAIREVFSGIDTNVSDTFDAYYYNGSAWINSAVQVDLDNTQYNNIATGLVGLGVNKYVSHFLYLGPGGGIVLVYGRQNNNKQAEAEAEPVPSTLPLRLQKGSVFLGKIVILNGAATPTSILSSFNNVFVGAGISIHNDTTGLQGGTTSEYYHLTNADYTAAVNLSGKLATKANLSGATFTGALVGTSISATTISGGTIYSGTTALSTVIDRYSTRVQNGSNITTGGTANAPSVNLSSNISLSNIAFNGGVTGGTNTVLAAETLVLRNNQTIGKATLSSGAVTVNTTSIHSSDSIVLLTVQTFAGAPFAQPVYVANISNNTSFDILSPDPSDTSTVAWMIVKY